jgi:sugar phosphate permease
MAFQKSSNALATPYAHDRMHVYRFFVFLAISATYLVSYFHRAAPAVVGPVLMKEYSLTPSTLGFIGSMYFWAYAATALPAGLLSDTWGARKTIAVFVFLAGIGGFMFANASDTAWMAAGRFVIGLGVGVVYVAAMRIISDWYKKDELATYSGVLLAVGNVGALISTTPLVYLMNSVGWRVSFNIVAIITIVASVVSYVVIRNKPSDLCSFCNEYDDGEETNTPSITLLSSVKTVFKQKRFHMLGLLLFSYYGTFMGVGSLWAGPYLESVYSVSKQVSGSILMMFPLGMTIGCPLAGYISDKIVKSRKKTLIWGCLLHSVCYVPLIVYTGSMSQIFLYMLFFWYGISGGAFVACFACAKEIFEPRFAGTAVGALNIYLFTGGAFYQNVIGSIINVMQRSSSVDASFVYKMAFVAPLFGLAIGAFVFAFFKEDPVH